MSKCTIKLSDTENSIPVVRFQIGNGQAGYAIVDTGSECTIFDTAFIHDNEPVFGTTVTLPYAIAHIAGIDERPSTEYYTTAVTFGDDQQPFTVTALSYPINHLSKFFRESRENINVTAIFGTDFLSETNANINFETKEMTLENDLLGK